MAIGLCNAPFERVRDHVLQGLYGKKCLMYLHDINVLVKSFVEHTNDLEEVFHRIAEGK